jgi:hypothetical protein
MASARSVRAVRLSSHELTNHPGLLDDEDGTTDLGTLEKKLAEKAQMRSRQASQATSNPNSPSQDTSVREGPASTPQSSLTSPEPQKDKDEDTRRNSVVAPEKSEEDVEALSEMMCSLVTNQSGETRYFGRCRYSSNYVTDPSAVVTLSSVVVI